MSGDVLALVAGTLLAVGALAFVLYPLFFAVSDHTRRTETRAADDSAILALREIEFDKATGKLSESDYAELKRQYAERALRELRSAPAAGVAAGVPADDIEARALAFRATHRECPACGVRPEPDAVYCSTCGGYLDRKCNVCGADVIESGATFCSTCGAALARSARVPVSAR
jgi:hypothetical protein